MSPTDRLLSIWERSSVGSERIPDKDEVAGSNPAVPTMEYEDVEDKRNVMEGNDGLLYCLVDEFYPIGVLARIYWIDGEPCYHRGEVLTDTPRVITAKLQGQYAAYLQSKLGDSWRQKLKEAGAILPKWLKKKFSWKGLFFPARK